MIFKRYEWRILLRVLILFLTLLVACILVVKAWFAYLIICVPLIIAELIDFLRFQKKAQDEVEQFVQSVQYRDFSRHFDVGRAPQELKPLRKGFNDINTTFKVISRERETQYQYLQKVLELVDTGIVSYELETGEIGWLNESFKKIFGIPYLKTIHSLQKRDEALYNEAMAMKPGDSKVVSITRDKQVIKILLTVSLMRSDEKMYRLMAFQNVSEALDETESKAWQKLLNVMTHEIMNSVAPISSLADTLKNRLHSYASQDNKSGDLDDLELGIDTIKRRSEGLLKFTESYRSLNKITRLDLTKTLVRDLFENLNSLMLPTLDQKNIELDIVLRDPQMMIEVDINLIEQVLINLLVNAIEAVKDKPEPCITLSAEIRPNGKAVLKIADNGLGMPPELIEKIFIPFFSTRKTGSGIGLSLCKQIMILHKGNIQVQSVQGEGSVFILLF
ncbi:histidine kinase/DNA gyrase B/HSP90-like ATPase [Mucilaginibacter gracilis]|uniref:histidine kinase n=1 Tax=Mucilaginibacter gracilis TaxID=423350 RepID=A0A495J9Y1_9SPHI|nr:HAMP domain-containing sensor histidine kinase [Mucilaginibacter gracilis]RKR85735.1 histidine kinase/DNA gyrase B/HSP90-like ATPase [Mucilaginibacter gracilis]